MTASIPASQRWLTLLWAIVLTLTAGAQEQPPPPPPTPPSPPPPASSPAAAPAAVPAAVPATAPAALPGSAIAGMQPADYLDYVGQNVKARWRQLYREGPPPASVERLGVAFTLGGLMAESYLAVQAGDAQQFRNNNQEVQKLCNVLALSDKIGPDINAGSKMAEGADWPALRKQVLQTQQHIESVLDEQRDEDLAILMDIGLWFRLFDMSTALVIADPALQNKTLCIGSVAMLNEVVARYERLTETARSNEAIALVGGVLEMLQRRWTNAGGNATDELVQFTHEKLKYVIMKVEAK
jgi:hypothetical protein